MNISSLKYHLSVMIKGENSSTLGKFRKGGKGLRPMGSNANR